MRLEKLGSFINSADRGKTVSKIFVRSLSLNIGGLFQFRQTFEFRLTNQITYNLRHSKQTY